MAVRSPQDVYASHVSSSRGYPMWTPEPSSELMSYRPDGLRIGDVGVVVPENGNFDVFFNLCLPNDHHFHRATGVPDGFSPVELGDTDIKTVLDAETAGRVVAAPSVTRVGGANGEVLPRIDEAGTTSYTFNLSSNEGALLILPEGAESHDVRDPRPFFDQASRHAATWYHFVEENLGRIISHDSIYIITGFHKARSWGLAAYQNEQGEGDFSARFIVGEREGGNMATNYSWEATQHMDWRVGPFDSPGIPDQSVFIRGFKVALRSSVQGVPQRWVSSVPSQPNQEASTSDSWLANAWRGISKTMGMSSGDADQADSHETAGVHIEVQRIPEILPVFHPSDVINQYILEKEPSAKVAITHDSVWGSILDKNLLKHEELVQDDLLTKAVSEQYTIISQEGVVYLQNKSDSGAFIGAISDDLPTAEAINQTPMSGADESTDIKGRNGATRPGHSQSLSVVSESNYRCQDETASKIAPKGRPTDLQSIPSKFGTGTILGTSTSPESLRPIKIIVISDFLCGFCYVCDKVIRDAIEACRDLPVRFDVECRPFTLVNFRALPAAVTKQVLYRNAYLVKKYGKEQADIKIKAVDELAQKAGLTVAEDSIICRTTEAHRLSTKAYQAGGQVLQYKLNMVLFDACLAKGANISDEDILVEAAVKTGLMNKEEATEFLHSTECSDCVNTMVEAARTQGISGVPFVIIDGKWAVNGLQPIECYIQIFRKLAQLPPSLSDPLKMKTENGVH